MAVPAFPINRVVVSALSTPPKPLMVTLEPSTTTPQPNWRRASSITRVSSESSRSCKVVAPSHKADSSSRRLEMLLEPGSKTRPPALTKGGMSRNSVVNIGLRPLLLLLGHAPVRTESTGILKLLSQGVPVTTGDHDFKSLQAALEYLRLSQQLFAIRHHDVAPHNRV